MDTEEKERLQRECTSDNLQSALDFLLKTTYFSANDSIGLGS